MFFIWKTAYHEITSNTKSSLILFCKFLFFICFLFRFLNHSPRNNIVWKVTRDYCLCYCETFSLVPDSTECAKNFLPKSVVDYLYHLKSNNIIGQRKTTNTENQTLLSMIDFVELKTFLYIANTCK